ncbi:Sec-independent protein translocase protein TatB [Methylomarinum sp. Ch1-1]|uniref:Sec-independent protein translocase protein TatB n=1 Tax=Methylomarinum roseum TaxID=3067653 RepID=A0AAU7NWX4_9GAMM|nr:Sec-independent protein translocase protein TatB [Methylomarinum sp. Ch1-1]MDP4522476.1 Sec-independent protein translocase protein TatB [Methylomarinum sp. Ch1-1]
MFDIGFWELCLVGLISLLVIGPERLPKAARIAGFWVGKTRNMVASVKAEIKEELQAEEMRQMLRQHNPMDEVHEVLEDGKDALKEVDSAVNSVVEADKKDKPND